MSELPDYTGSRAARIWKRLATWATAAAVLGASPAISASPPPTPYAWSPAVLSEKGTGVAAITFGDAGLALEEVSHEISITRRILKTFASDFLQEVDTYLSTLESVLSLDLTSVSSAARLGAGLRAARVRLEEDASSLRVWGRLASCIDEKPMTGRRIPRRFVRTRAVENEASIREQWSSLGARRAATAFANGDADSSSRSG